MNKYIIPICDIENSKVYIKTIIAKSNLECQEKLTLYLIDTYNINDTSLNYREFINLYHLGGFFSKEELTNMPSVSSTLLTSHFEISPVNLESLNI